MRYGKKLALVLEADRSNRHYVSHVSLKQELSSFLRECKMNLDHTACISNFAQIFHSDTLIVAAQVQADLKQASSGLDQLDLRGRALGIVDSDVLFRLLGVTNDVLTSQHTALLSASSDSLRSIWFSVTVDLASYADAYNAAASKVNSLLKYAEINIAGFRKLLKQFFKQVPEYESQSACIPVSRGMRRDFSNLNMYQEISLALPDLCNRLETFRLRIEEVLASLLPEPPKLVVCALGTETMLAISEAVTARIHEGNECFPILTRTEDSNPKTAFPKYVARESMNC